MERFSLGHQDVSLFGLLGDLVLKHNKIMIKIMIQIRMNNHGFNGVLW